MLLGAAFGGLYGAAGGTLTFPLIGTVVGLFFGALSGAVVGLPLGVLDGVLLSWLAVRYSYHERPNTRRYRARAGIVCAVGSLLALVADWALHDLPDPNDFAARARHRDGPRAPAADPLRLLAERRACRRMARGQGPPSTPPDHGA